jgi:deoxyxylulose-5-phosphate synthase
VGEDGPTHAGAYDYAFMRTVPNLVIMAPKDENECRQMLHTAYKKSFRLGLTLFQIEKDSIA